MPVFVPNASLPALTFSAVSLRLLLARLLLEFHVAKLHNGSNYFIAAVLFIGQEAEDVHGVLQRSREKVNLTTLHLDSTCRVESADEETLTSVAISSSPSSTFSTVVTPCEQKW